MYRIKGSIESTQIKGGITLVLLIYFMAFVLMLYVCRFPVETSILQLMQSTTTGLPLGGGRLSTSSNAPSSTKGVVMCAYNDQSIRLAWTQIQALRQLPDFDATNTNFTIYHVDELDESSPSVLALNEMPGVSVENLAPLITHQIYADVIKEEKKPPIKIFQGYKCKAAAVLAAPYDVVSVLDFDAVLLHDPFALLQTSIYQARGAYLFRDRRLLRVYGGRETWDEYIELIKKLWKMRHPDKLKSRQIPGSIMEAPMMTRWSWDYGESAVVVWDKKRLKRGTKMLKWLLSLEPEFPFAQYTFGDKEYYWLSLALAEEPFEVNPIVPNAVGELSLVDSKPKHQIEAKGKTRERTCSYKRTLAQSTLEHRLFYVQGEGVEDLITEGEDYLLRQGHMPMRFLTTEESQAENLPVEKNMCSMGGKPLSQQLKDRLQVYRDLYLSYRM